MVPALTLENGETVVDSERSRCGWRNSIRSRRFFLPGQRGLHLALARYIDTAVEDALFRVAVPDELAILSAAGAGHEAMWRLIRERKYGEGFVDRMGDANWIELENRGAQVSRHSRSNSARE